MTDRVSHLQALATHRPLIYWPLTGPNIWASPRPESVGPSQALTHWPPAGMKALASHRHQHIGLSQALVYWPLQALTQLSLPGSNS